MTELYEYRCSCALLLRPAIVEDFARCPFCKDRIERFGDPINAGIQEIVKEIQHRVTA